MSKTQEVLALFQPLSWQVEPFYCKDSVILLSGSAGSGKSQLGQEKIHAYCLHYPGSTGLLLRKSRASLANSTLLSFETVVVGGDPRVRHAISRFRYEYSNGSVVVYGGMFDEEQAENIRSIGKKGGLDIVFMEEATEFSEHDFNEVAGRMRGKAAPWQQIVLACNPSHPKHWINRRLIIGGEATCFYAHARDNSHLPKTYIAFLNMLTGVQKKRLVEGKWVAAEGAVWPMWDQEVHVVDRFDIPRDWQRVRIIDFGYRNPFVCLWAATSPDNELYVYRQLYKRGKLVSVMAQEILAAEDEDETISFTLCDWDAEGRATLEDEGFKNVYPADKAVTRGVQAVEARLRGVDSEVVRQEWKDHEDDPDWQPEVIKPSLFVLRNSLIDQDQSLFDLGLPTCLEEEIPGYVWPKDVSGKPQRELPVKENDHGADCARYLCAYYDFAPKDDLKPILTNSPFRDGR